MLASKSYNFYIACGRLISPLALASLGVYGRIAHIKRARVVVLNEVGEILLVRSWIGRRVWELPGGGVERGEHPQVAAQRELFEETGIAMPRSAFIYVATLHGAYEAPIYQVTVTKSQLPQKRHNPKEIIDLQWCAATDLLADTSELVSKSLRMMSKMDEI